VIRASNCSAARLRPAAPSSLRRSASKGHVVTGRNQQARDSVGHELRERPLADRDDRQPCRHRLERCVAEGVDLARHREDVRPRKQLFDLAVACTNVGPDLDAVAGRDLLERHERQLSRGGESALPHLDEAPATLSFHRCPHEDDARPCARGSWCRRRRKRDAEGHDFDLGRGDTVGQDRVRRPARVGHDPPRRPIDAPFERDARRNGDRRDRGRYTTGDPKGVLPVGRIERHDRRDPLHLRDA